MDSPPDLKAPRLFVHQPLAAGTRVPLEWSKAHYLLNVLRLKEGNEVLLFNGVDGEWLATLGGGRKASQMVVERRTRPQEPPPDLHYLFAPLKQARLDYMVQKAVELGVGVLQPVLTQHTQVNRMNRERMESNAIEAVEQCGMIALPQIGDPEPLRGVLDTWPARHRERRIIYCDEAMEDGDPITILKGLPASPLAVLIGPEGGFSVEERMLLRARSFVTPIPLGHRIMRADTAAVAALALVQATLGDWRAVAPAAARQ
jgi:16S rRNA (uracil1498-N3)-methyltransferase